MGNERESSADAVATLLNQKIDQLIEVVTEIKNNLTTISDDVRDLQLDMRDVQNMNKQQQKEIEEQKQASKDAKKWIGGLVATVAGGILVAVLKVGLGL